MDGIRKVVLYIIMIMLLVSLTGCVNESVADEETYDLIEEIEDFSVNVKEVKKHGNVVLDMTYDELKEHDIEIADIITVAVNDETYEMPVGTSFTDVDSGEMILRYDKDDNEIMLAINSGDFATETGMAVKEETDEDPGYIWNMNVDSVTLTLKEKQGYGDEYEIRNLESSTNREDYADLSDEDFANYRCIQTTNIKEDTLYRSSSPINPKLGRNTYVMEAMETDGIKTVINLTDSKEEMKAYETYKDSYYSQCNIVNVPMGYNYDSEDFDNNVKQCLEFMNDNDGPYLIHCTEGKDRTGILCALIELYAGASYEEAVEDYMETYAYYYGVEKDSETYDKIITTCFNKSLMDCLKVSDPASDDLQDATTSYFKSIGLTDEELNILNTKICK